jgi:hypothetical protein
MLIPIVVGALVAFVVVSFFVDRYRKRHRVDGWLSETDRLDALEVENRIVETEGRVIENGGGLPPTWGR